MADDFAIENNTAYVPDEGNTTSFAEPTPPEVSFDEVSTDPVASANSGDMSGQSELVKGSADPGSEFINPDGDDVAIASHDTENEQRTTDPVDFIFDKPPTENLDKTPSIPTETDLEKDLPDDPDPTWWLKDSDPDKRDIASIGDGTTHLV